MNFKLRIWLLLLSLILFLITTFYVKRKKIPVKYSLIWYGSSLLLLLISVIPKMLIQIANILGFKAMSNLAIGVLLVLLLSITMILTMIVSKQRNKITLLVQEVSLLKEKMEEKK